MNSEFRITDQTLPYFLTFQVVDWIDIFTRCANKEIIISSFQYCIEKKGLILYAYVIMTNHIHIIAQAKTGINLSDIVRDFKKFTSVELLKQIKLPTESRSDWILKRFEFAAKGNKRKNPNQLWTHDNHAEQLYSDNFIRQKLNYIHLNPVRSGIVGKPEDYIYSSASNYANLPSRLKVELIG